MYNPRDLIPLIKRGNSVLVVWDVQEALVNSIFNRSEFIAKLKELIDAARKYGVPIVYTKITRYPSGFEPQYMRGRAWEPGDIVKDVYPQSGDIILNKHTPSIFVGTSFELYLRNSGRFVIVFTGIATNYGVETSARHAQALGFLPVIAREAVSSGDREAHERSLANMALLFPVLTNEEIIKAWESG